MARFTEDSVLQSSVIVFAGLIGLFLIISVYQAFRNWQDHQVRRQMAAAHHWRYSGRGWRMIFRTAYTISGSTPSGVIWQLKRVTSERRLWLTWTAYTKLLPYGQLVIRPRQSDDPFPGVDRRHLRPMNAGGHQWQGAFTMLATHDVLGQRFFDQEIEMILLDWLSWPAAGSIQEIVWQRGQLGIRCRYHPDPRHLERIAALGTTLIENVARQRQVSL